MFRRFGFLFVAALCAASPVAAQDERPVQLTIGGGWTGVYGAGKDHVGSGGNFTLGALFKPSPVDLDPGRVRLERHEAETAVGPGLDQSARHRRRADRFLRRRQHAVWRRKLSSVHQPGKARRTGWSASASTIARSPISTPAIGYATICDPYWYVCYPAAVPVEQVVGSRSSTDFGMNFGGGVNFKMTDHASIYAEVRYHYIWGPEVSGAYRGNVDARRRPTASSCRSPSDSASERNPPPDYGIPPPIPPSGGSYFLNVREKPATYMSPPMDPRSALFPSIHTLARLMCALVARRSAGIWKSNSR